MLFPNNDKPQYFTQIRYDFSLKCYNNPYHKEHLKN